MALIHCNFFSPVLGLSCSMDAIIPEPARLPDGTILDGKQVFPVLYLLHGYSDDHTIWQRRTSIERYVRDINLIVIMPAVDTSFYTDMARGKKYWTFISEELPSIVRFLFPVSTARKDTYVAGLSMGGYGAMKLALIYPDRYGAAASLSGALDIAQVANGPGRDWRKEMKTIFGDVKKVAGSQNDLFSLAESVASSKWKKMPLFVCCGTEDFLIDANHKFRGHSKALGLNLTYEEEPGVHDWDYWDKKIQRVLNWLPVKKSKQDLKSKN